MTNNDGRSAGARKDIIPADFAYALFGSIAVGSMLWGVALAVVTHL